MPPMPPMPPMSGIAGAAAFVLRRFRNHRFGRQQQARNGRRILQRKTRDLGRIENTGFDHVTELASGSVVAVVAFAFRNGVQQRRSDRHQRC